MARAWSMRSQLVPAETRILIVDDSRAIHDQVDAALAAHGYQDIYHAGSAQEAVTFYEAKRPDIVLVDMLMPGPDGAELCRELLARHPKASLVVLTALPPEHPKVIDALSQGARAIIHKPVGARDLVAALQKVHAS